MLRGGIIHQFNQWLPIEVGVEIFILPATTTPRSECESGNVFPKLDDIHESVFLEEHSQLVRFPYFPMQLCDPLTIHTESSGTALFCSILRIQPTLSTIISPHSAA